MTVQPDDPRITAYIFDELSPDDKQAFEQALQTDESLRAAVAATRTSIDQLKQELRAESSPGLTPQQRASLDEVVGKAPLTVASKEDKNRGGRAPWIALTVSLLLLLGVSLFAVARNHQYQLLRRQVAINNARQLTVSMHDFSQVPSEWGASGRSSTSAEPAVAGDKVVASVDLHRATKDDAQALQYAIQARRHAESAKREAILTEEKAQLAKHLVAEISAPEVVRLSIRSGSEAARHEFESRKYGEELDVAKGRGPGMGGDQFGHLVENPFRDVELHPRLTFSIDVDTASYAKVRQFLLQHHQLPPADAVRIEELINYFNYDYAGPQDDKPFAAQMEIAECPWNPQHRLARIGIKAKEIKNDKRPSSNLVFLLDVSGSMNQPNKLPLVKEGIRMLVEQLGENDRVAIVVYAGASGLVLDSTTGDQKEVILEAIERLHAGGSTNGGAGLKLAYQTALDHYIKGGTNRVLLCSDGDFNVGVTSPGEIVRLAESHAKQDIYLSVLGFGIGNLNDDLLEQVSNKANGNYAFVDTKQEAHKILVDQMSGTLVTVAKDVKIQLEFNPRQVAAYRLIGYENRILATEDFNDDTKDAGEIGAGHTVTALYELVPANTEPETETPAVDPLKYQQPAQLTDAADSGELLTLNIRSKLPSAETSTLQSFAIRDEGQRFGQASRDFRFASAVAGFGMLLRQSQYKGELTYAAVLEFVADVAADNDRYGYRREFIDIVTQAKSLSDGQDDSK